MNDARHDPEAPYVATLQWKNARPRLLGEWMDEVTARLAALEARLLTMRDLCATVRDVPGTRYVLEDTMYDLEPPKPGAVDGDDYTFAHDTPVPAAPAASGVQTLEFRHAPQPIGAPGQPPRDCSTWTVRVDDRLAALERENAALRAAVARHADALQVLVLRGDDGK